MSVRYCSPKCQLEDWKNHKSKCKQMKEQRLNVNTPNVKIELDLCASCEKNESKSACSVCKVTRYCSRECQTTHWKEHKILFGITAPYKDGWVLPGCQVKGAEWVYLPTQAIKDGPIVQDRFCVAPDLVHAMVLFRSFLANHPMLKTKNGKLRMAAARDNPEQFAKVMAESCLFGAGNAVAYPRAVMRIIEQENLRRYD